MIRAREVGVEWVNSCWIVLWLESKTWRLPINSFTPHPSTTPAEEYSESGWGGGDICLPNAMRLARKENQAESFHANRQGVGAPWFIKAQGKQAPGALQKCGGGRGRGRGLCVRR